MIIASIATIPQRRLNVLDTIMSLVGQVDAVNVQMNKYTHSEFSELQEVLRERLPVKHKDILQKIHFTFSDGKLRDCAKFKGNRAAPSGSYFFTCDDDIIYPPDYVTTTIKHIHENPGSIITYHGRIFPYKLISSYFDDHLYKVRCLFGHKGGKRILHIPGSGVSAWKTSDFHFAAAVGLPGMADINLGMVAAVKGVKIIAPNFPAGWIVSQKTTGPTLYEEFKGNNKEQTAIINAMRSGGLII